MLKKIKQDSHNQFQQLGYPSKKLENWKFSSSSHLKKYKSESINDNDLSIEQYSNKYTLCFINGELSQESLNDFFYKDHISISDIETLNDNEVSATSSNFKKRMLFCLFIGREICPVFNFFKISNISWDKDFELIQPKLPLLLDEDEML